MKVAIVILVVAAVVLCQAQAIRPPLFLQGNVICTLQPTGAIPSGPGVVRPTYIRVCRRVVVGSLGDAVDDDDQLTADGSKSLDETSTSNDEDELARAIMSKSGVKQD